MMDRPMELSPVALEAALCGIASLVGQRANSNAGRDVGQQGGRGAEETRRNPKRPERDHEAEDLP